MLKENYHIRKKAHPISHKQSSNIKPPRSLSTHIEKFNILIE
jgi:hypothetical protein